MGELVQKGGNALWFGPPPIINAAGENCLDKWENLFGVKYNSTELQGRIAVGMRIDFANQMKDIPAQYVLSDFMVDRIYPVEAMSGTAELAYCDNDLLVGTSNENAYYFGFRPRDDQSASLGYETRTLFEILDHVGAYASTGTFQGVNDNTEHVSRTSDYLCTRFPNGATNVVRHYRSHRETWDGGFSRNAEVDAAALAANPLPPEEIVLEDFKVNGHELTFDGTLTMAFRMNAGGELIAFEGQDCKQIKIDGKLYKFSDAPLGKIAFAPSLDKKNELLIQVQGQSSVSIPLSKEIASGKLKLTDGKGKKVKFKKSADAIQIDAAGGLSGKMLLLSW